MNKKILHVVPTLKKDGAETQLLILLKELKKSSLSIDLITFDFFSEGKSIQKDLSEQGINVDEFKKNILSTIFYLYKRLNQENYDIVHSHLPKSDILVGIVNLFIKFNHVVSIHAQYGTRKKEPRVKYFFLFPLWRLFINRADKVIAISEKVKSWLISRGVVSHINVIHYGIEPKNKYHNSQDSCQIGMAARFLPWKGWEDLITVVSRINELGFLFNLHLAGPDDIGYKNELVSLIKNNGLEKNVIFHEEFQDIYDFFDLIDVFVFLSESEGFGLVLLEAMSYGLPIVCSDIAPINEFVDSRTGILVDKRDIDGIAEKIISLLSNKKEQLTMKENQIYKVSNKLNAEIMATKVKELYYSP